MHAAQMNAVGHSEFAGNLYSVCVGSAMQCSKHHHFIWSRDLRYSIHHLKQRGDYTTLGAARLRCIA